MYRIVFTDEALKDLRKLISNKQAMIKLEKLLEEIKEHPRFGTGQIEHLMYYVEETWSRRIDKKNRIVYTVDDEIIVVTIMSITGHYKDK